MYFYSRFPRWRWIPLLALLCALPLLANPLFANGEGEFEFTGKIEAMPPTVVGEWLIGGRVVVVTPQTEIDDGGAALAVGACVAVEGNVGLAGAFVADEIEREDDEKCGGVPQEPKPTEVELEGIVEAAPSGGLIGAWMIAGRTVITTEFTEFDGDGAQFFVGACVEVEGVLNAEGAIVAKTMETDDDCGGPVGEGEPNGAEIRGVVEATPLLGLIGEFVISGVAVEISGTTEIKTEAGPLEVGACVKAEGEVTADGAFAAAQIKVLAAEECSGPRGVEIEFIGRIDATASAGLEGEWTIAGRTVTANASTEFDLELGPAEVGACVKVEGSPSGAGIMAREIRVLGADCAFPLPVSIEVSFEGRVQTVPSEGVEGTWRINGRTVIVNSSTEVELNGAAPTTGLCAEVEGELTAPGVIVASELEVDGDDCGFGPGGPSGEVEITGRVEAVPPSGRNGEWTIAGVTVMVSAMTEIDDSGIPGVGACVKVEGSMTAAGVLAATEIEAENEGNCEAAAGASVEFTGLVTARPEGAGLAGNWTISGRTVVVAGDTEVDESDGPLRTGACVEVEGVLQADSSIAATEIDVESAAGLCVRAVVNAASFQAEAVSPGQIVSIFGLGLGPSGGLGLQVAEGRVRTRLRGLRVTFDDDEAPILFASATQVNVVAPYSLEGKARTRVRVEWANGFSKSFELEVRATAPGILTLTQSGVGQAAALNVEADGSVSINGSGNPARPGQIISLFATGEGQTNPPGVDGKVVAASELPRPRAGVNVTIGGQAATVLYAGGAPGLVSGVLQVNVVVPETVTAQGDVEVLLEIGGVASALGVTIAVE